MSNIPTAPATAAERAMNRYKEQYGVIVICRDERDQQEIFERLRSLERPLKVVTT